MHRSFRFLRQRRVWLAGGSLALAAGAWMLASLQPGSSTESQVEQAQRAAVPAGSSEEAPAQGGRELSWDARIAAAGRRDFAGLFLSALEIHDAAERQRVLQSLVKRWMMTDLKGFVAFVDAVEVNDSVAGGIWSVLAPVLAAVLPQLDDDTASAPIIREVVRRLIAYWCEADPGRALAWAKEFLNGDILESALVVVVPNLARTSVEQASEVLATMQMAVRRVEAMNGLGEVLAQQDPQKAVEWAQNLANPAERPYAMSAVLAALAETEPKAASAEFDRFRKQMTDDFAATQQRERGLGPLNPADAVEGNLEPGAAPAVPVNPQLHLLNDAAVAIAENWGKADPSAALGWVQGFSEGKMKYDAMGSILGGWAATDGAQAFAFYSPYAADQPALAEPLFRSWASSDPVSAAKSVVTLGDWAAQQSAVGGVIDGWLEHGGNLRQIEQWADSLPPVARDAANAQLVAASSEEQPYDAWQRALRIQDPQARLEALDTSFASLTVSDVAGAGQALAAAHLPKQELDRLKQMLEATGGRLP